MQKCIIFLTRLPLRAIARFMSHASWKIVPTNLLFQETHGAFEFLFSVVDRVTNGKSFPQYVDFFLRAFPKSKLLSHVTSRLLSSASVLASITKWAKTMAVNYRRPVTIWLGFNPHYDRTFQEIYCTFVNVYQKNNLEKKQNLIFCFSLF